MKQYVIEYTLTIDHGPFDRHEEIHISNPVTAPNRMQAILEWETTYRYNTEAIRALEVNNHDGIYF
jgi:hypothetical protein